MADLSPCIVSWTGTCQATISSWIRYNRTRPGKAEAKRSPLIYRVHSRISTTGEYSMLLVQSKDEHEVAGWHFYALSQAIAMSLS